MLLCECRPMSFLNTVLILGLLCRKIYSSSYLFRLIPTYRKQNSIKLQNGRGIGPIIGYVMLCYSFIQAISIAFLQVHYNSEVHPTQHGYCVGVSCQSATGNCE